MADHIRKLKDASKDAWVDLKMGVDNALGELRLRLPLRYPCLIRFVYAQISRSQPIEEEGNVIGNS